MNQHNFPYQSGNKTIGSSSRRTETTKREPLKCLGRGEENILREYPHQQPDNRRVYNAHEASKFNDVSKSMPKIHVSLENRQVDHQVLVVEMECMITNHLVCIIIDLSYNLSYDSPQTVEKCKLQ
jgi:hypothetical protein